MAPCEGSSHTAASRNPEGAAAVAGWGENVGQAGDSPEKAGIARLETGLDNPFLVGLGLGLDLASGAMEGGEESASRQHRPSGRMREEDRRHPAAGTFLFLAAVGTAAAGTVGDNGGYTAAEQEAPSRYGCGTTDPDRRPHHIS